MNNTEVQEKELIPMTEVKLNIEDPLLNYFKESYLAFKAEQAEISRKEKLFFELFHEEVGYGLYKAEDSHLDLTKWKIEKKYNDKKSNLEGDKLFYVRCYTEWFCFDFATKNKEIMCNYHKVWKEVEKYFNN